MKDQFAIASKDQSRPRRLRELDLLLDLDRASAVPLRVALEQALREAVRDGRLVRGTALPSSRALAVELGLSRGVVVEAYAQLAADGFVVARPGGATRVAEVPPSASAAGGRHPSSWSPPLPAGGDAPFTGTRVSGGPGVPRPTFDLLPMSGDLTAFPRRAWTRALRRAVDETPATDLSYTDPRGPHAVREALAAYLGRSRGVLASPATVAITGGVTDGLGAVVRALVADGRGRIAVEDPGFEPHRRSLAAAGAELVAIPVDRHGLRVDELERHDVAAVLVTPAHQSPMGCALSPARRSALVGWAAAGDRLVLEDDYDGEFRHDRLAVRALQGLAPEHVVHLGSVSKTLAPALRVGWLVAPAPVVAAAAAQRALVLGGTSILEPRALAAMLQSGDYDRNLRAQRRRHTRVRTALTAALARELPDGVVVGAAAGLHVTILLPASVDPDRLLAAAGRLGLLVTAGAVRYEDATPVVVVVGHGRLAEPAVAEAIARLGRAVREARG